MSINNEGTLRYPEHKVQRAKKLRRYDIRTMVINFYNRMMPSDLRIRSLSDGYYALGVIILAVGIIVPAFIITAGYCIFKASKEDRDE
jgi:hypothetical protein